jgi:hypothetical protein
MHPEATVASVLALHETGLNNCEISNESAAVSIYVSRKADVARLDEFVGPKR